MWEWDACRAAQHWANEAGTCDDKVMASRDRHMGSTTSVHKSANTALT